MELINQRTKRIMEGCKERARQAGLSFDNETLEYIVSNRDLLELSPKLMIPTLYDYWVQDVEVLKEKGRYELYPGNPYETVINTRPAISFYNDNNPDWLNVMIFYHVLAHIDFFQNNQFFSNTWDYDLAGQALSDKRMIAKLRSEKGRWVDYIIEFARSIDNLVDYHGELSQLDRPPATAAKARLDYYFDVFLQSVKKLKTGEYIAEVERYNACMEKDGEFGERSFFDKVGRKHPEFDTLYEKSLKKEPGQKTDLVRFILDHSVFLNRDENKWMKSLVETVRKTSLYFQPQIRTKIMNEGWASYWHEKLFLDDDRIRGHEVDFARVHAGVTSLPRVGMNPYALGMRLFGHLEEMANKGKFSALFQRLADTEERERYDLCTGKGQEFIFKVRESYCDFMFLNTFVDQDFVNAYKLFVAGKRLNKAKMVWEYYVKSRKAQDYQSMVLGTLYHPPRIEIAGGIKDDGSLRLVHRFEGKPLVREYIAGTMMGIEQLWGKPVHLETSEVVAAAPPAEGEKAEVQWRRVLYTMEDKKLSSATL